MAGKKTRKPSLVLMIVKTVVALFLLLIIISSVAAMAESIRDDYENSSENVARMIGYCDRDYYDRDYGRLLSTLDLYDLYGEDYEKYWEAVNAYEDFIYYTECKGLKGYEEEAEKCLAKIRDNARNCKFEENRKILEGFVDQSQ